MPSIPKYTKCSVLGCKNQKSRLNSFCMEHGGKERYEYDRVKADPKYLDKQKKYKSPQWQRLRQAQLSTHPLCASCLSKGIITQAEHIDHVFPWNHIGDVAFYHNIFQSLCQPCHSDKTYLESKGIFRKYGIPCIDYSVADYTRICGTMT